MIIDLKILHSALGGEVCSGQVLCPGPGHSPKDRSLAVRPTSTGFVVHSFSGDDFRDCQSHVRRRLGLPQWQAGRGPRQQPSSRVFFPRSNDDHSRIKRAQEIWEEGRDPRSTAAEQYLAARKLHLPPALCGSVLRFHPRCPWQNEFIPCLIAALTSISDNTVTAIHRIRVDRSDRWPKTERKMLGAVAGSAIKLDPQGSRLAVAQGLESALAARQLGFGATWALGSAREFAPVDGVKQLIILGEHDAASRKGAESCALPWREKGRTVFLALPTIGKDFNDYLMGASQ